MALLYYSENMEAETKKVEKVRKLLEKRCNRRNQSAYCRIEARSELKAFDALEFKYQVQLAESYGF